MDKEEFYNTCEGILLSGSVYQKSQQHNRRSNRWGPRIPGNGRYADCGVIRYFGPTLIQVCLTNPIIQTVCYSPEEVFDVLNQYKYERENYD